MRLQQLLVVLDPTQEAQPALNRAAWLARHSQAHLDLLLCEFTPALEGALWLDSTRLEQCPQQAPTNKEHNKGKG